MKPPRAGPWGTSATLEDCVPAPSIMGCRTVGRYLLRELPKAGLRLLVGVVLFIAITHVRWPAHVGNTVTLAAGALLGAAVLMICGSLLYNTLYYARYWRQADNR